MTVSTEPRVVQVCGKYPLALQPFKGSTNHSYFKYLQHADKNSRCTEYLIKDLPKGLSVIEHFGGVGMTGVMIQTLLEPSSHKIFDIDPDCVSQLQSVFGDKAAYGDAKELMGTMYADLITLDFPNMTANHHHEWPLDRVFAIGPKYIVMCDIAKQRIGLHRDLWSRIFGKPIFDNEDYMNALSERWSKQYGYAIRKVAAHAYSFLLLTPGEITPIDFWKL